MDEKQLMGRIQELVDEEHRLRQQLQDGAIDASEEHDRLRQAEEQLDRMWDLLRQRRARSEAGLNPDEATPRPVPEVETYEQ